MSVKVIIGADIVPTDSNKVFFSNGEIDKLIDKNILKVLADADYRIFNLEVPLTDQEKPIKKCGPNLIASTSSINGYEKLNIDFLTLANNHIMDQSAQGLMSTLKLLDAAGIAHAGAGHNLSEAMIPYIFECQGNKFGIYCCAEHEFSIAEENRAGANPFDALESLDHIASLKKQCDYVICLYHGGREHYRYPSPYLRRVCRKIGEKGADLVVCQHSHCIGCEEQWYGSTIIYGQGNFLFDYSNNECWRTSILVMLEIGEKSEIMYVPIVKNENGVKLADEIEKREILTSFFRRSEQIKENGFVESEYKKFAETKIQEYVLSSDIIGGSFVVRAVNKMCGGRLKKSIAQNKISENREKLINQYNCEAHRELILKGLEADGR